MSEAFLERMSQFTPDAGGLDRDALIFAAGRRSARPNRGWKAAASLLAASQALSLILLWPQPNPTGSPSTIPVANGPVSTKTHEASVPEVSVNPDAWADRQRLLESNLNLLPAADVTFVDREPPLRAVAPPSPSLVN